MMAVVVTNGAIRHIKLWSNLHHQQTNIQLFKGQMPFLSPNQQQGHLTCKKAAHNIKLQLDYNSLILKISMVKL